VALPLFSIVTITYQNLEGLRRTVESVRALSFCDLEHIVIDGGSTDGTAEWLAANFDGSWVSEPDGGRYHAMNKGARMARGEYLWFMHAGDAFGDPLVLQRVATAIEGAKTRPEWLYGLARVVNSDGSLLSTLGIVPFRMFNFAVLLRPMPHQATAIRRELFWKIGGYDEQFGIAADQLLMLRAADVTPPMPLADFLCDFDGTGISANRSAWSLYRDGRRMVRHLSTPVMRWRVLDNLLALSYALIRQLAQSFRATALRPNENAGSGQLPSPDLTGHPS
jgi:glycosyltransferase involved in cell wall biosynthesis